MTKLLVAFVLALLATPALAGPNLTPAPSGPAIQVALQVDGGKDQRHYTVKLLDKSCGSVTAKTNGVNDEIKVCATVEGANVRLEVHWQLHEKGRDIENKSELVLVHGATQELDGGTAKLSVSLS